jgi:uncharacterized repeat protein (TIGR02543 family)
VGVTLPTGVTKDGYTFGGWYDNADFSGSKVTAISTSDNGNKVFFACWINKNTHIVSGTVKDDQDGKVNGATVTIRGNGINPQSTTTDLNGAYSFAGIPAGEYNIVASYNSIVQTIIVTVADSDVTDANITLPTGKKNSILTVAADTPDIVVGYLDQQFTNDDNTAISSGSSVVITLAVEEQDESIATGAEDIQTAASGQTIDMYLDMTLLKTASDAATSSTSTLSTSVSLLKIIVPYDLTGKASIIVYRYHGGAAEAMTAAAYSSGTPANECYMVNTSANQVIIWTKSFSTYAISYAVPKSGRSRSSASYTITAAVGTSVGGSISPSGSVSVTSGGNKTFTITADQGYYISDVLVDGKSVGVIGTYTFSAITKNHNIEAVFAKNTGLPYYLNDAGKKVFIGFAAETGGEMKYIALDGVTVLFKENPKQFTDINGHWAQPVIDFVTEREIFVGTGGSLFSPDTGMTRAMFATVIGRLYERSYGDLKISDVSAFTDCDYDEWYGSYVNWCAENGIVTGVGGGLFQPDREITRAEMAAIIYRFAKFMGNLATGSEETELSYPDAADIASWTTEAALYCQQTGIIQGRDGGNFSPQGTATRAEVAAILQRFIKNTLK